ncbi:MAG: FtsX-like permease family protein [Planctomycetota bacterium]|jgi:hypothetical protein
MKVVEVKEQVRPPLKRCVELVLSGIKYRLFRAAITVVIIALAVAFLMTMLTESLITRRVAEAIEAETAPRSLLQFWVGRLAAAPSEQELNDILAGLTPDGKRWKELAQWGELRDERMAVLVDVARRQRAYLDFFDSLSEGHRRILAERQRGAAILTSFIDQDRPEAEGVQLREDKLATFEQRLRQLGELSRFPSTIEEFKQFLGIWRTTAKQRTKIIQKHEEALAELNKPGGPLAERTPTEFLAAADEASLERLADKDVGFSITAAELETLKREAALTVDAERIERMLSSGFFKAGLAKRREEKVTDVNPQMLFSELESAEGAKAFIELTDKAEGFKTLTFTVERLIEVADRALAPRGREPPGRADAALARDIETVKKLAESSLITEELTKRMKGRESELAVPISGPTMAALSPMPRPLLLVTFLEPAIFQPPQPTKLETTAVTLLLRELKGREYKGAEWLAGLLAAIRPMEPLGLSVERIQEVAKARLARSRLAETEASVSQMTTETGFMGFSSRMIWLIVVSFMVCIVGTANAMLMSVTERFREIATMKCLGATDGFIMISFVLESCMQGVFGSLLGLVLGFILGTVRTWAMYGLIAMEHLPAIDLLAAGGFSVALGILISALAAVYPAWVAARLAPMEAMRIE